MSALRAASAKHGVGQETRAQDRTKRLYWMISSCVAGLIKSADEKTPRGSQREPSTFALLRFDQNFDIAFHLQEVLIRRIIKQHVVEVSK